MDAQKKDLERRTTEGETGKMREADYACNKNRSQFLFLQLEPSNAHVLARRLPSEKLDPHPELCPALSGYSLPVDAITGITPL